MNSVLWNQFSSKPHVLLFIIINSSPSTVSTDHMQMGIGPYMKE